MPFDGGETDKKRMEGILRGEKAGYLGLSIDGNPYVVPLNYGYVDGRIVFHCALTGRKLDGLLADPRVCLTVPDRPVLQNLARRERSRAATVLYCTPRRAA